MLVGVALLVGGLFLNWRAGNFEARQTPTPNLNLSQTTQTPADDNRAANEASAPTTPNESPAEKPKSAATIVALNDRAGMVTIDKRGDISGLDDVPASTRDEIAQALLSERIERPNILKNLAGQDSTLRGNKGQSFRLISPARSVLVSDRPTFKWEKLSGASAYRVYVNDPHDQEVARSEELSPQHAEWAVPKPLKRGRIYAWTVVAVVEGKEIVSPGPSSPEMKFQVLSTSGLQHLNKLKKTRSHLALGVFYARKGMIAEAEGEFQTLVGENPRSPVAKKLLGEIQSWQ